MAGNKTKKPFKDLIGQTFFKWTVLQRAESPSSQSSVYWRCKCSCGKIKIICGANLRLGRSKSCGHPKWKDDKPELEIQNGYRVCSKCLQAKKECEFYGDHSWCAECNRKQKKQDYQSHPLIFKERTLKRRKEVPQQIQIENKQWREKNPDYFPPCKLQNPHYSRDWAAQHKEELITYARRWRKRHPEVHRARAARYRARKYGAIQGDALELKKYYKWLHDAEKIWCYWCRQLIPFELRAADHYIPLSKGGRHDCQNLVPSCLSCNSRKNSMMPQEFQKLLDTETNLVTIT